MHRGLLGKYAISQLFNYATSIRFVVQLNVCFEYTSHLFNVNNYGQAAVLWIVIGFKILGSLKDFFIQLFNKSS